MDTINPKSSRDKSESEYKANWAAFGWIPKRDQQIIRVSGHSRAISRYITLQGASTLSQDLLMIEVNAEREHYSQS